MIRNEIDEPLISVVALRTDDRVIGSTRFAGGGGRRFSRTPRTSSRRIVCERVADQFDRLTDKIGQPAG